MIKRAGELLFKKIMTRIHHEKESGPREYAVGPYTIMLPVGHRLDSYQKTYKRYDIALGEIANIIAQKYPNMTALDIGANIGDSAALICKYQKIPVLCIEGDKHFIPLLRENSARIGAHIIIEECFIGADTQYIDEKTIDKYRIEC